MGKHIDYEEFRRYIMIYLYHNRNVKYVENRTLTKLQKDLKVNITTLNCGLYELKGMKFIDFIKTGNRKLWYLTELGLKEIENKG